MDNDVSRRKPEFQFLLRAALPRASWIPAHAGMMTLVPSPVSRVTEEVEEGHLRGLPTQVRSPMG
jgi:hypothetical protein